MRKLGVRVVSAALAACMMASVMPVSAFAAGEGNDSGAAAYVEAVDPYTTYTRTETGDTAAYTLNAGTYTSCIALGGENVIVTINGTVDFAPTDSSTGLFRVGGGVKSLTINADSSIVNTGSKSFLTVQLNASDLTSLTVNGGTYNVDGGISILQGSNDALVTTLKDATVNASGTAVSNNGGGTVTIAGGSYSTTGNTAPVLLNGGDSTLVLKEGAKVTNEGDGYGIRNAKGTVTVESGTIETHGSAIATESGSTTNVKGGTFESDDRVLTSAGTLVIGTENQSDHTVPRIVNKTGRNGTVTNTEGGKLTIHGGTITTNAGVGAGVVTIGGASQTEINDGVIEGCNGGIVLQSGKPTVTVKKVTLNDNKHDIVLGSDQIITLDENYTGTPSTHVIDPENDRQLTYGVQTGTELPESHNPGYSVISENGNYYLHRNDLHKLTFTDASAKSNDGSEDADGNEILKDLTSGEEVAAGTKVCLTANPAQDSNRVFDKWKVTKGETALTEEELREVLKVTGDGTATLTMPDYDITVSATYKDKPAEPSVNPGGDTPDGGNGGNGGALAAVVVGGAAAWGIYEAGTGIYRMMNMRGIPLPTTRAELALLIWQRADKPEPESTALYDDIDEDDTDLQKAAHWMVEQELMDEKDNNKFKPYGHVTKLRVCTTWNEAKEKGLIG